MDETNICMYMPHSLHSTIQFLSSGVFPLCYTVNHKIKIKHGPCLQKSYDLLGIAKHYAY